jgi:hypothetical protein
MLSAQAAVHDLVCQFHIGTAVRLPRAIITHVHRMACICVVYVIQSLLIVHRRCLLGSRDRLRRKVCVPATAFGTSGELASPLVVVFGGYWLLFD